MKIHHIGIVLANLAEGQQRYTALFGLNPISEPVSDPAQKARLQLLGDGCGGIFVELVEPAGPGSPTAKFLDQGGGLHHICYETQSMDKTIRYMRSQGALLIAKPVPAELFGGRMVAFMYTKAKELVELLEACPDC